LGKVPSKHETYVNSQGIGQILGKVAFFDLSAKKSKKPNRPSVSGPLLPVKEETSNPIHWEEGQNEQLFTAASTFVVLS
jgi:hypothetical protein